MTTIKYNVFVGYEQPAQYEQTAYSTIINELITSQEVTDPDTGETKTAWYVGKQTIIANDAVMVEVANTTAEQDELIAELLEAQE